LPYKPGLKWLAGKWLEREIQASEGGHDSEEDARACMDLLKLKMANGEQFVLGRS
jgi:RNA exonuclease 1